MAPDRETGMCVHCSDILSEDVERRTRQSPAAGCDRLRRNDEIQDRIGCALFTPLFYGSPKDAIYQPRKRIYHDKNGLK
jgi:hypothetical protein